MNDYLIIGGGVIGMLTARELARAGARVGLVERGAVGRESSWAGGGILSPLHPWRLPDALTALCAWSQRRYTALAEELRRESDVDPEWTRSGLLILEDMERIEAAAWAARHGVRLEALEPQAVRGYEPALGMAPPALWLPEVAQIRNPRLVKALHQSIVASGVELEEHCEVTSILAREGRAVGVQTARGPRYADKLVLASGAWSGQLLEGLGCALPVTPVRGQMLLYQAPPGLLSHIVVYQDHYLIPRRDGRVLVGSTVEQVGFDKSTTGGARRELQRAAETLLPELANYPIERHWSGLRPGSPTGVPFIGEHPGVRNLYLNTGHFRNGLAAGPASARLLADELLGRPPIHDPAPYLPC
ncbi:MAG: glycine oxidase ThiO [Pseudomonadota bacterium]